MSEKHLKWLKSKSGYLKINAIERDLKMPQGTLKKYIDGKRELAEHWKPEVIEWIKTFNK